VYSVFPLKRGGESREYANPVSSAGGQQYRALRWHHNKEGGEAVKILKYFFGSPGPLGITNTATQGDETAFFAPLSYPWQQCSPSSRRTIIQNPLDSGRKLITITNGKNSGGRKKVLILATGPKNPCLGQNHNMVNLV
jgi:hypothetical protein